MKNILKRYYYLFIEVSEVLLKEAEFTEKQMKILEEKINDEEAKELFNQNEDVENQILSKYKKWSEFLEKEKKEHIKNFADNLYEYNENIKEGIKI